MNWLKKIFKRKEKITLSFRDKFKYFQNLIKANDKAHEALSEMGEMIVLAEPFSRSHANLVYNTLFTQTELIVDNLVAMSGGKYQILRKKLDTIEADSNKILNPKYYCPEGFECPDRDCHICPKIRKEPKDIPFYYDIKDITAESYLEVGGKMSRLGEIKNKLGLPVPDGFSLTVRLFDEIMDNNDLRSKKEEIFSKVDFSVISQIRKASRETQNLFISNPFSKEIENLILEVFDRKYGRNSNMKLAVRSSALGEDSDKYSFAGLHHSELNVSRENLIDACYEVLISKYSPQSIVYRFINGLRDEDMPMSVCCLEMIDAAAAGVLFTCDPNNQKNGVIIQAVKGLGVLVVEGSVIPQEYIVEHDENAAILNFQSGQQDYQSIVMESDGVFKSHLSSEESSIPCLTNDQVRSLIRYALKIEEHFGGPQDIEWAFDRNGHLYILQARPLKVEEKKAHSSTVVDIEQLDKENNVLISQGDAASHGIAAGPVRKINSPKDFINFPENGIIVSRKNLPEFASLIHKASAVVTDYGSTTGHLSIIARELGVPILTNTKFASKVLKEGQEITINADSQRVYEGYVEELIKYREENIISKSAFLNSPLYNIWHRLSKFIFKLNLYNPDSENFNASGCVTLHDIIRFSHETAMKLMFTMFRDSRRREGKTYELRFNVPLDIYIIDLEGGLKEGIKRDWVKPDEIISLPFIALIKGMTTPGIRWSGHLPIDFKGYASIIFGNIIDVSRNDSEMGAKSYSLISENYLNFFSRLGYHFTRIDAFASDEVNANYIHFNFRGGAADSVRKARRARAVKMILEHYGFTAETQEDSVIARIRKIPKDMVLELVEILGKLMGAVRNTDVTLVTEKHKDLFVEYFLAGDPAPALRLYEHK